jgi:molybdopterin/thiamine biosynthesis adenylyltransferase
MPVAGSNLPRIVVCGAGALGGSLVEHLARSALRAAIVVIDRDRVEAENVDNQPYDLRQARLPKVHALAERIYEACGREIDAVHATLGAGNAQRLLRGAAVVVDALDNAQSRLAVRDACVALGITALHAGLGTDGYVEVRTNEGYRVETPQGGEAPCRNATTRSQVLLAVVLTAESVRRALEGAPVSNRAMYLAAIWESAETL